ncbi:helicase-related protein [Rappaport israeli]|uniref:helicase-related protein n=1 Tax=Rappaport israeli TaxID=1839807 RepID=UPI0038CD2139
MPPANERLNLLFSATMAQKVQELAYEHFNAPITINIESEQATADNIEQRLYHTAKHEKTPLLIGLLEKEQPKRAIIFLNTKRDLERLSIVLDANGYKNAALSSDVAQHKREKVIKAFLEGKINLLVATDVAARGLHIPEVTHVFNYDLPQMAEDYVHRIGRTARAGASGTAISFSCEEYVYSLPDIEHYLDDKIPVANFDDTLLADVIPPSEEAIQELRESRISNKPHTKRNPNHKNIRNTANKRSHNGNNEASGNRRRKVSAKKRAHDN